MLVVVKQIVCEGKPDADIFNYILQNFFQLEKIRFKGANSEQRRMNYMLEKTHLDLKMFHAFQDASSSHDIIVYHPKSSGKSGVLKVISTPEFTDSFKETTTTLCGAIDINTGDIASILETIRSAVKGEPIEQKMYTFRSDPFAIVALPVGIPSLQISDLTFKTSKMDDIVLNVAWNNSKYQILVQNAIDLFLRKTERNPNQKELVAIISAFVKNNNYKNVHELIREIIKPLSKNDLASLVPKHMLDSMNEFLMA